MNDDRCLQLAKQIADDLRGAAFYADQDILSDFVRGEVGTESSSKKVAVEIIRSLLMKYSHQSSEIDAVTVINAVLRTYIHH